MGKSIADHMRDAIALGKSVYEATAYVRAQCSCARCPNKRMHELYAFLLPNARDGLERQGESEGRGQALRQSRLEYRELESRPPA